MLCGISNMLMLSLNTYTIFILLYVILFQKNNAFVVREIRKMRCYHYYSDTYIFLSLCTYTALCTLFCVDSCYSGTRLHSIKTTANGSLHRAMHAEMRTISKGEISMNCFRTMGIYNFNGILTQRIDRKDQDQETLRLETRAAKKIYKDHA